MSDNNDNNCCNELFLFVVKQKAKQGIPAYVELENLGVDIGRDWKKLGRRLELDEPIIQEIDNGHGQLSEKGYNMLMRWKQNKGANATYKALHDALQHNLIHRQDLVEKFCYLKGNLLLLLCVIFSRLLKNEPKHSLG